MRRLLPTEHTHPRKEQPTTNSNLLPLPNLSLDDPRGIAGFLLRLGYEQDNVARALVSKCGLDTGTAARIVADEVEQGDFPPPGET